MIERLLKVPLWSVIERHFDEAEFSLEVWLQALDAPDYSLEELAAGPEQRIFAHWKGSESPAPRLSKS